MELKNLQNTPQCYDLAYDKKGRRIQTKLKMSDKNIGNGSLFFELILNLKWRYCLSENETNKISVLNAESWGDMLSKETSVFIINKTNLGGKRGLLDRYLIETTFTGH